MTRPPFPNPAFHLRWMALPLLGLLAGCDAVVLSPAGDIALQQRNLILVATGLMLLVILPVMALTVFFAWKYRQSNDATYSPDWDHSTQLELAIWAIPLLIIIVLGAVTWTSTHLLDPYRPIERIAPGRAIAKDVRTLEVEVVALDWKWLFIYPRYGIATVNELAAPVNVPIRFKLTASTVMNSFYIPALAGQIYAMPGMETKLHAVINRPGRFLGFAANYNGAGFSKMNFKFHGMTPGDFNGWVAGVKARGGTLDRANYLRLERPSEDVAPLRFARVAPDLYKAALNMCVRPGTTCMSDMMMADRMADVRGGSARGADGHPAAGNAEGKTEGALTREPGAKGEAPHWSKSREAPAPGARTNGPDRRPNTNRDFTLNLAPGRALRPGSIEPARS